MTHVSIPTTLTASSWAARMASSVLESYPPVRWKWHYEHGVFVRAGTTVAAVGGDSRLQGFDQVWVDHFVGPDGAFDTYRMDEFNLDQIYPGRLLFPLYQRTGDLRYQIALHHLRAQLSQQPRTPSNGFWHKQIYPNQMWLDGLYMAGPFYAEYAQAFAEPGIFDDLTHQFALIEAHTRDPRTGLLYHAWDESQSQRWADPLTGCSPHFWGRAMGWFVMALIDVLDYLPPAHSDHGELVAMLNRLAQALIHYQAPASGLWYQVVDQSSRPGNYREASVSAMLAYGFAKGVRLGWLPPEFLTAALRAYHGLLENMIRIDSRGALTLEGTCSVAGLGGIPYRDGSYEYYIKEPVAANDFKGVGPFILAALELDTVKPDPR